MADTAFQIQYRQEYIAAFEQHQSFLRDSVTTEAVISGNQAVFLVAGSGDAEATTRGTNGLIPARGDDLSQPAATLQEWHDLVRKTKFNIFASQGNQREIMQKTSIGVLNRRVDKDIITELNTATQDTGATQTATVALAMRGLVILGNNDVPYDGQITGLITPAFLAYMMQTPEFASADYVDGKPFEKGVPVQRPMRLYWNNMFWIVHPNLPGKGTSAEKCFFYHKDAIGHAFDKDGLETPVGHNEEQGYYWARASGILGSKLLQNSGVVVINHDGSAFAAE